MVCGRRLPTVYVNRKITISEAFQNRLGKAWSVLGSKTYKHYYNTIYCKEKKKVTTVYVSGMFWNSSIPD